jgi:hypothetical protein
LTTSFADHCRQAAKDFLQTVLVIDDGATLGAEPPTGEPKTAARASPVSLKGAMGAKGLSWAETRHAEASASSPVTASTGHSLDAKALTDAFFQNGIVVGLFKPTKESIEVNNIVENSVLIARKSDVVIIDWTLDHPVPGAAAKREGNGSGSHLATGIITGLLKDDGCRGRRLRTIIVYTAETDLRALRDQLLKALNDAKLVDSITGKAIEFAGDGEFGIAGRHMRIAFYSKSHGQAVAQERKKTESELPAVVVEEFWAHANGLLPAFALQSVAAIRRNTHHLLTKFPEDLDGSYLAHRGMLPDPEDAEPYMLENFVSVIRNMLSVERVDQKCLGEEALSLWIQDRDAKNQSFSGNCCGKAVTCKPLELADVVAKGASELEALIYKKSGKTTNAEKKGVELDQAFLDAAQLLAAQGGEDALYRFAVLGSFRRSHADIAWAGPEHAPYLTQGAIIAKAITGDSRYEYMLCITPKCDCIRIGKAGKPPKSRTFSFARLSEKNLTEPCDVVIEMDGKYLALATDKKFHRLMHIDFAAKRDVLRVESEFSEHLRYFFFRDVDGCEYRWVGDLKDLHMQTRVSGLVGDLNRVGLDEFEWLRIKAKK